MSDSTSKIQPTFSLATIEERPIYCYAVGMEFGNLTAQPRLLPHSEGSSLVAEELSLQGLGIILTNDTCFVFTTWIDGFRVHVICTRDDRQVINSDIWEYPHIEKLEAEHDERRELIAQEIFRASQGSDREIVFPVFGADQMKASPAWQLMPFNWKSK